MRYFKIPLCRNFLRNDKIKRFKRQEIFYEIKWLKRRIKEKILQNKITRNTKINYGIKKSVKDAIQSKFRPQYHISDYYPTSLHYFGWNFTSKSEFHHSCAIQSKFRPQYQVSDYYPTSLHYFGWNFRIFEEN